MAVGDKKVILSPIYYGEGILINFKTVFWKKALHNEECFKKV